MNQSLERWSAKAREIQAAEQSALKNQQWTGKLKTEEKQLLARSMKAYGLDLLSRHAYVMGGNLYISRDGMTAIACKSGDYGGCKFEKLEPERQGEVRYKCTVTKLFFDKLQNVVHTGEFEDIGKAHPDTVKAPEIKKHFIEEMALKRAHSRALRRAWPIAIQSFEEITPGMVEEAGHNPVQADAHVIEEELPPEPPREPGEEG